MDPTTGLDDTVPSPIADRSVGLAIGLGWQLAIVYFALCRPDRSPQGDVDAADGAADGASTPDAPARLPPVGMLVRTVSSRARSLGLGEEGPERGWVQAMDSLLEGAALGEEEASRVARELHLGLVEALSKSNDLLRPAYELGRLLSETVVVATGAPAAQQPSVYRQLFDPLRLLPLADWLALLEGALPTAAGYAVFASLQRWSRWVVAANDPDLLHSADALREQGRLWRDLLLDRPVATTRRPLGSTPGADGRAPDTDSRRAASALGPTITQSLADISMTAAFTARRADRPPLFDDSGLSEALALADAITRLPNRAPGAATPSGVEAVRDVEAAPVHGEFSSSALGPDAPATAVDLDAHHELARGLGGDPGTAGDERPTAHAGVIPTNGVGANVVDAVAPAPVAFDERTDAERGVVAATAPRLVRRLRAREGRRSTRAGVKVAGALASAAVAVLVLRTFVAAPFYVPTASMSPTLQPGDHMLVDKVAGSVHRGDIVVFHTLSSVAGIAKGTDLVKRVIGLPGDRLSSVGDRIYVNGAPLAQPWLPALKGSCAEAAYDIAPQVVPAGHYFVMGDCRGDSVDSRSFGSVASSSIIGKVFVVVWRDNHPWFAWF